MTGSALNAYAAAGIASDHEAATVEEGRERLRAGLWLLIREASSARNLRALLPLALEYGPHRMAFCTDDREPEHIADDGHINAIVRDAVALGLAPEDAVVMASLNPAAYHGLDHLGAIAPGRRADILVLSDLESFVPELVLKRGPAGRARSPAVEVPDWVRNTVHLGEISPASLEVPWNGGRARVIGLVPDQIITASLEDDLTTADGLAVGDPARDLAKIAVFERHLQTGRVAVGLRPRLRAASAARSARASPTTPTTSSSSGVDDRSILTVAERLRDLGGGLVVADGDRVLAELPLPVAGLLSDRPLAEVLAGEPRARRRCPEPRRDVPAARADAGVPLPVGDPVAEDHRPRPRRRRALRARAAGRRLIVPLKGPARRTGPPPRPARHSSPLRTGAGTSMCRQSSSATCAARRRGRRGPGPSSTQRV